MRAPSLHLQWHQRVRQEWLSRTPCGAHPYAAVFFFVRRIHVEATALDDLKDGMIAFEGNLRHKVVDDARPSFQSRPCCAPLRVRSGPQSTRPCLLHSMRPRPVRSTRHFLQEAFGKRLISDLRIRDSVGHRIWLRGTRRESRYNTSSAGQFRTACSGKRSPDTCVDSS
jgi:hypothetical protein